MVNQESLEGRCLLWNPDGIRCKVCAII